MRVLLVALLAMLGLVFIAPPAQAATQAVAMQGYAFSPSTLTVHVGDTVTWTNYDQAPHDVTTTSAPVAIKSQTLSTGQSFSYTFTTAGTYSYYCSIHPDMRATVTVQPAVAAAAPVPAATSAAPKPSVKATVVPKSPSAAVVPAPATLQPAPMVMPESTVAPAPVEQQAVVAAATPTTTTTLDPMLLVAGVAAGIAVLCLLVLASRRHT